MVRDGEADNFECPAYVNSRFIQVAYVYTKIFTNIRSAFSVAGLEVFIDVSRLYGIIYITEQKCANEIFCVFSAKIEVRRSRFSSIE